MKPKFTVHLRSFTEIDPISSTWEPTHYRALLQQLEFDDAASIPDVDLKDMALMALQDLKPDDAAEAVLALRLGDRLTPGQRQELSHEMLEDTVWEEHPDMSEHEELFNASTLLHEAFPDRFPPALAIRVQLEVNAENEPSRDELEDVSEPFLCRLLADGMSDDSILRRLFEEQIAGAAFPDAEHIIWRFDVERPTPQQALVSLVTARGWVADIEDAETYASTATGDREDDVDEETAE